MNAMLDHMPSGVAAAFRYMGIAEELLRPSDPRGAFMLLCPTPALGARERLYRAHVIELLRRVRAGEDTRPATDAECLGVMLDTSLVAPLNRSGQAVVDELWVRLFPESPLPGEQTTGLHPGQVDDDIAAMRRRLAQRERRA